MKIIIAIFIIGLVACGIFLVARFVYRDISEISITTPEAPYENPDEKICHEHGGIVIRSGWTDMMKECQILTTTTNQK